MSKVASLVKRAKLWPWALIARIAAIITAVVIVVLIYRQLIVVPGQLRHANAEAKQDVRAAEGVVTVTGAAADIVKERTVYRDRTREIVKENTREILAAPGASDPVPAELNDAFLDAIGQLRQQADQRDGAADRLSEDRP